MEDELEFINIQSALDFYLDTWYTEQAFNTWLCWVQDSSTIHTWIQVFNYTWKVPPYLFDHYPYDYSQQEWATLCYNPLCPILNDLAVDSSLVQEARQYWLDQVNKYLVN